VYLVRDVLDKQLVDKAEVRVGKVNGIVLRLDEHGRPKVEALELGASTLAKRLLIGVGLRARAHGRDGYRLAWSHVTDVGIDITVDADRRELPLERWQEWLRRNVLSWIPGGLS